MNADGLARAARDDAIRAAAARFCPEMSGRAAAEYLRSRLLSYRSGPFQRDRFLETPPDRLWRLAAATLAALLMFTPVA